MFINVRNGVSLNSPSYFTSLISIAVYGVESFILHRVSRIEQGRFRASHTTSSSRTIKASPKKSSTLKTMFLVDGNLSSGFQKTKIGSLRSKDQKGKEARDRKKRVPKTIFLSLIRKKIRSIISTIPQ